MKTFKLNSVLRTISNQPAKTHILANKKEYTKVTEPFIYDGTEIDILWLNKKENKNKIRQKDGEIFLIGSRAVWHLIEA